MRKKPLLGQNFLTDHHLASEIVRLAHRAPEGRVVEKGPGKGILTKHLLECAGSVLAVEVDHRLFGNLNRRFGKHT